MLRVVQMGLGPIGIAIAGHVHDHAGMSLVGAVDSKASLAGKDVGELAGTGRLGVQVEGTLDSVLGRTQPDVVLHATGSHLDEVAGQLRGIIARGINLLSTCEELSYPYYRHPELSRRLDEEARAAGAVLLGAGINPGFVMDKLAATLTAACHEVRSVVVERVVDAATRREPFQRKIGAGLSRERFEELGSAGRLGHVGLTESAHMLADVIGLGSGRSLREELYPVMATTRVASEFLTVEPGQVAGIEQRAVVEQDGVERVRMELQMCMGAARPRDSVSIEGIPPLELTIDSGIHGDVGTAAVMVNCAPLLSALEPGLRTILDVPLLLAAGNGSGA